MTFAELERRILALMASELSDGCDGIHEAKAAAIYGVPIDKVTPTMRRVAKAMNYMDAYGFDRKPSIHLRPVAITVGDNDRKPRYDRKPCREDGEKK